METKFLTLREASEFLRISVATLNRFMRDERIPSYKVGGRRLFDQAELVEWVRSHRSSFGGEAEVIEE